MSEKIILFLHFGAVFHIAHSAMFAMSQKLIESGNADQYINHVRSGGAHAPENLADVPASDRENSPVQAADHEQDKYQHVQSLVFPHHI